MIDAAAELVRALPDLAEVVCGQHGGVVRIAHGLWIGRIFVRATFDDETAIHVHTRKRVNVQRRWVLDLPGTQISLVRCRTFDVALQIADELSRNAPGIHEARTLSEIESSVPKSVVQWLTYAQLAEGKGEAPMSFRDWRTGQ